MCTILNFSQLSYIMSVLYSLDKPEPRGTVEKRISNYDGQTDGLTDGLMRTDRLTNGQKAGPIFKQT